MKTIGILGGLGPEASVDYYKEIINQINAIPNWRWEFSTRALKMNCLGSCKR